MKTIPELADADTTLRSGKPEVRVDIDRPRAADLGVSVDGHRTGAQYAGRRAGGLDLQRRRRSVRRASCAPHEQFRDSVEGLAQMTVPSTKRLGRWGSMKWSRIAQRHGASSINRLNRQRQVTLTGNVLPGGSQADVLQRMSEAGAQT